MLFHLPIATRAPGGVYPVLPSAELGAKPRRVELHGEAFVLWRDASGRPGALLDRCPHRFAPLSAGRVRPDGRLACGYHGWHFDAEGHGQSPSQPTLTGCDQASVRVSERYGFIWLADHDAQDPHPQPLDDDAMTLVAVHSDATLGPRDAVLDRLDGLSALLALRSLFGFGARDLQALDYTLTESPEALTEVLRAALSPPGWRGPLGASDLLRVTVTTRPRPLRVTLGLSARRALARVELFAVPQTALRTALHAMIFAPPAHARALQAALWAARLHARTLGTVPSDPRSLMPLPATLPGYFTSKSEGEYFRALGIRRAMLGSSLPRPLAPAVKVVPTEKPVASWEGFIPFVVARRVEETHDIASYYLRPKDPFGFPLGLPLALPGQHITLRANSPVTGRPVMRNYSLSDLASGGEEYRISVKRIVAKKTDGSLINGLFSGILHDDFRPGSVIDVRAPKGNFHLDAAVGPRVTLLAGGVGLTPLYAMLRAVALGGGTRQVSLLHAVRTRKDTLFEKNLREMALGTPGLSVRWFLSEEPGEAPLEPLDFQRGFISLEALRESNESLDGDFYLCGPSPMMVAVCDLLMDAGVPAERIQYEGFGPVTLPRLPRKTAPAALSPAQGVTVTFTRSGRSARWTPGSGSLLDFAREHGITLESGCCVGSCSTCATTVTSGTVRYLRSPGEIPPAGRCLVCVSEPETDLTLDV